MLMQKTVTLKNGTTCLLRNAEPEDAEAYIAYYNKAHSESDNMSTYVDEANHDAAEMATQLEEIKNDERSIETVAIIDGELIGSAGIYLMRDRDKLRHRAYFGISIIEKYCGLGLGTILTRECIEAARRANYQQLELEVVAANERAIRLYQKCGFVEFGRNPLGFRTREGVFQELIHMRIVL